MPFVNESVPADDIDRHGLRAINRDFVMGDLSYYWTIDRERGIYLRAMGNDRDDPAEWRFSFYWKGHLLRMHLRVIEVSGTRGGSGRQTWGLSALARGRTLWLPPELESSREEITLDLKEALQAYKGGGIHSTFTDYVARFEF